MLHRSSAARTFPDIDGWTIVRGAWCVALGECSRRIWADPSDSLVISANRDATAGQAFLLTFANVAQFDIVFASRTIVVRRFDADICDQTIGHLLVDQIWPRILAHDGALVLHASAVSNDQGAILFVGASGRGKSTLAASLHQRGLPLIGDDAIKVDQDGGGTRCEAVYRSMRLFADSIDTLFDPSIDQSDVASYSDKRNVHFPSLDPAAAVHRVRALFFIGAESEHADASVGVVSPADACMRLIEHNFWLDPTDMARTTRKLSRASALATAIPAFQLDYPRDFAKLDEVHAAIFSVLA